MIGTTSEWIEVPDLGQKKLTLSSIFIRPLPPDDPDDEVDAAAKEKKKENNQFAFSDFSNQAFRVLPEGSQLEMYSVIYNAGTSAGKTDLVIHPEIWRDNVVVYSPPLRSVSDPGPDVSRIPYGVRISLKDLKPGKYTLKFSVIDRISKTTAEKQIGIEIEE